MHAELALLNNCLVVGAVLFGLGLVGFLSRRNMLIMFLSAEMMLQGASLSFAAWGRFHNDFGGQTLVLFIIAVAAAEAAIALALVLTLFALRGRLDIAAWHDLREAHLPPPLIDEEGEQVEAAPPRPRPRLSPAGLPPPLPPDMEHRLRL